MDISNSILGFSILIFLICLFLVVIQLKVAKENKDVEILKKENSLVSGGNNHANLYDENLYSTSLNTEKFNHDKNNYHLPVKEEIGG